MVGLAAVNVFALESTTENEEATKVVEDVREFVIAEGNAALEEFEIVSGMVLYHGLVMARECARRA